MCPAGCRLKNNYSGRSNTCTVNGLGVPDVAACGRQRCSIRSVDQNQNNNEEFRTPFTCQIFNLRRTLRSAVFRQVLPKMQQNKNFVLCWHICRLGHRSSTYSSTLPLSAGFVPLPLQRLLDDTVALLEGRRLGVEVVAYY